MLMRACMGQAGQTQLIERSRTEIEKTCKAATLARVPKNTPQHIPRAKGKAKGWFFHDVETILTTPRGMVIGQVHDDSCVAACVRMLAADEGSEQPEAYLRDLLQTERGTFLSQVPDVLQTLRLSQRFIYRRDLQLTELQRATEQGAALAYLAKLDEETGHAVIVETITDEWVTIRDPLPAGTGRAYRVHVTDFMKNWLSENSDRGRAVIVLE